MTLEKAISIAIAWAILMFIFKKVRSSEEQTGTIINIIIDLIGMAAIGSIILVIPNSEDVVGWMTNWAGDFARYLPLFGIAALLLARSGKIGFLAKTGVTIGISILAGVIVASTDEWAEILNALTALTAVILVAGLRSIAVLVEFVELVAGFAQLDFEVDTSAWNINLGQ